MTNTPSDWIERLEYRGYVTGEGMTELLAFLKGLGEGRSFEIWVCPECGNIRHYDFDVHAYSTNSDCSGKPTRITVSDGFLKGTKERLEAAEKLKRIGNELVSVLEQDSMRTPGVDGWIKDWRAANREAK